MQISVIETAIPSRKKPQPAATACATPVLSIHEQTALWQIIASALLIGTVSDFEDWTGNQLQGLFPHEMMVCGVGELRVKNATPRLLLSRNLPPNYLDSLRTDKGTVTSPIMARWKQQGSPQFYESSAPDLTHAALWRANFERHALINIAAHGVRDIGGNLSSYFSFYRIPGRLTPHHAFLLEVLIPNLHGALVRLYNTCPAQHPCSTLPQSTLGPRENQVLELLGQGKTNWEIGKLLGISEFTAKNHVHHLLQKLGVRNRAHAVAKFLG